MKEVGLNHWRNFLISLWKMRNHEVPLSYVLVEVAGVEPASCRVSIQVATSLVGTWMFSPEILATDLLIPEHHLKFY